MRTRGLAFVGAAVLARGGRGGAEAAILKLGTRALPNLVRNEAFVMEMARACGLAVAQTRIVTDRDGEPGLWVTRFDRARGRRLHQEDGCQLLDRYPEAKYRVSFTEVMDAVRDVVSSPPVELARLLELLAFSYLVVNGDLHARNVSVLVGVDGLVRLSPAYDLVTTLPYGDRKLALKVLGETIASSVRTSRRWRRGTSFRSRRSPAGWIASATRHRPGSTGSRRSASRRERPPTSGG